MGSISNSFIPINLCLFLYITRNETALDVKATISLRPNLSLDFFKNIRNLSTSKKVKSVAVLMLPLWHYRLQMYQKRLNSQCEYLPLLQCIASAFHRSSALDTRARDVLHPLRSFAVLHQSRRVRSAARLP